MPASSIHQSETYKKNNWLFIVNPGSGRNNTDWETEIRQFFEPRGEEFEIFELPDPCNPEILKDKISSSKANRVIAVGGDGTVKLVAGFLVNTDKELGILPAGSANGLAKELNIPSKPKEALEYCLSSRTQRIHLVKINDELCIHLADIGFNAFLVKTFEQQQGRGMWGYLKAALKIIWRHPHMDIKIQSDGKEITQRAAMVVVANATRYGSGAVINPLGRLDDDLFEIVVVKKISFKEIFKMMVTHRPYDHDKTEVFQTGRIEIKSRRRVHFQVDGEYLGKTDRIMASIVKNALQVIMPAEK
ncbi:diacylglycerol kinase family lipid kinase [Terrimonas sp. NA20]|uniref:Diacylglycerol kinase family lipid kinase n=1 Tax=Terrimonas ginsenosidimutans TaxID=2908004 RepID=A0ABS9KWA2_9BACT|nr:diacylglycerol kinase family protein [Terrimonas ginsenosidimutans]MCG2616601.1 diacylglycerol kinase family lipid kinase [Terrimonas ginsenosidimutans]